MHSNDQRSRHGERESIAFQESRRLGGGIRQDVRPSSRRLRHDIDEHQSERSRFGRVAQNVVDPSVKTAREGVAPAETAVGVPLCAVGDVPDELPSRVLD
jgi:hypothetical protein